MRIFNTILETRNYLQKARDEGKRIGFVPTMGALHHGHISLLQEATLENDVVVCSIFVNPIQFNKKEDLEKYPRTLDDDIIKLEEISCDVLFAPTVDEMYPEPFHDKYNFGHLDKVMEGKERPGHFNGVAVVVRRLFEIVEPDKAYFGMKDYQQLKVVQAMVDQLKMNLTIVPCATLREKDGLAMSSRNVRLTPHERLIAPAIFRVLQGLNDKVDELSPGEAEAWGVKQLSNYTEMNIEYLQIVDVNTLLPITAWNEVSGAVACVAVNLGKVRLIDNYILF